MSSRTYPIEVVDVFAERVLAGNQLAVVRQAADLSDEQMQAIARETNYSETTFVLEEGDGRARVRIFTPAFELPFAGHPTLGTAWVLTAGEGQIVLDLKVGPVAVDFVDGVGWFTPPPVALNATLSSAQGAALVGLDESRLDPQWPVQHAAVGPEFVIVGVRDLAALADVQIDVDARDALVAQGQGAHSIFIFSSQPHHSGADFAARMFFDVGGVREDPATGSANSAFAAYLRAHRGALGAVVVDQGVEMLRPSRLYLDVADTLRVGGRTFRSMRGELVV